MLMIRLYKTTAALGYLIACENEMNGNTHFLEEWAKDSNPQLNEKKTKQMLLTCNVISSLIVKGQTLESVRTFKLLGTWLNENLKWPDHVKELVSSCHKVLSILRKIRNMHGSTASKTSISGKSHHF